MVTILLVEDHAVVREGIRFLLERQPDFKVIAVSGEGLEAIQLAEELDPDVLILDLVLPGVNGMEVVRQVKRRSPRTKIVILSMYDDMGYVLDVFQNGASAYVLKSASALHLEEAVRAALQGSQYLSPPLLMTDVDKYAEKTRGGTLDPYETLTTREREVLELSAKGNTIPEIASRLFVSPRTAETHRANLMRKLDLDNQTDLVRYAVKRGILPLN